MTAFRALLAQLIDYAGLFPPAKLPLDHAIRNYANYRQDPDAWMLGRFIIPTTRLHELAALRPLFGADRPVPFAALGRGASQVAEFTAALCQDVADVAKFRRENAAWAGIEVLETKAPAAALTDDMAAGEIAALASQAQLTLYFEIGLADNWRAVVEALKKLPGHGFKLRCGGLEPAAFPASEQVASVIVACRHANVPLKCTAGLHHPVRHFSNDVQTKMHGFLNVFSAGILAHVHNLDALTVQTIVEDEDPKAFAFDAGVFRWRDIHATADQIADARRHAMISFGSCSFDEPRDDLRSLGLMP